MIKKISALLITLTLLLTGPDLTIKHVVAQMRVSAKAVTVQNLAIGKAPIAALTQTPLTAFGTAMPSLTSSLILPSLQQTQRQVTLGVLANKALNISALQLTQPQAAVTTQIKTKTTRAASMLKGLTQHPVIQSLSKQGRNTSTGIQTALLSQLFDQTAVRSANSAFLPRAASALSQQNRSSLNTSFTHRATTRNETFGIPDAVNNTDNTNIAVNALAWITNGVTKARKALTRHPLTAMAATLMLAPSLALAQVIESPVIGEAIAQTVASPTFGNAFAITSLNGSGLIIANILGLGVLWIISELSYEYSKYKDPFTGISALALTTTVLASIFLGWYGFTGAMIGSLISYWIFRNLAKRDQAPNRTLKKSALALLLITALAMVLSVGAVWAVANLGIVSLPVVATGAGLAAKIVTGFAYLGAAIGAVLGFFIPLRVAQYMRLDHGFWTAVGIIIGIMLIGPGAMLGHGIVEGLFTLLGSLF